MLALETLRRRDRQALVSAAWHTELFRRMQVLPPHDEVMARIAAPGETGEQTPDQQLAAARVIVEAFGG